MARSPKEAGKLTNMPKLDNQSGGFSSEKAAAGDNKPQPGSGLEQIDGEGMQSGAHPAKTQSKILRYF